MQIKHYGYNSMIECYGILFIDEITIMGTVYRCNVCGKRFTVDSRGRLIL